MAEKVTTMKLKVDLQCEKCYKKVKKILSKFSQIRDQVYDEKQNTVIIKVVCCNPEKIRDNLCCKGCGSIKSIEIVDTTKPELPPPARISIGICCVSCYEGRPGGPCLEGYGGPPPCYCGCNPEKIRDKLCCKGCGSVKSIEIVDTTKPELLGPETKPNTELPEEKSPPPATISIGICCVSCYEGRPGGPCLEGYSGPPQCYCGCNPEKIRDKLCCKGCGSVKSIEIVDTTKPELLGPETKPNTELPEEKSPPPATISIGICCVSCYEGRPGGPCLEGYSGPPPCYCGCYCGRPVYGSYGGGRPCYVSRCDQYFSDGNPSA